MVVSASLEPDATVNYTDLGEVLTTAVEAQLPPDERNDTAVTVTFDETAVGTFTAEPSANISTLTQTLTDEACTGTTTCNVTLVGDGDARRRLETSTALEYLIARSFDPEAQVAQIGTVLTESADKEEGVSDAGVKSSAITANVAIETQVAPRRAAPGHNLCAWVPRGLPS